TSPATTWSWTAAGRRGDGPHWSPPRRGVAVTRPLDLAVFVAYMALLAGVGFAFARRKSGAKEYLLAGQDVHWAVVAVSVLAALFSGISYLGAPAEAFFHDLTILWAVATFLIA